MIPKMSLAFEYVPKPLNQILGSPFLVFGRYNEATVEINSSSHFMEIVSRRVRPWLIWELIDNGFNLEDNNIATYVEFNNFIEDYLKERYGHEMDGFYRWRIKDRTK